MSTWLVLDFDGNVIEANGDLAALITPGQLAPTREDADRLGWGGTQAVRLGSPPGSTSPLRNRTVTLALSPVVVDPPGERLPVAVVYVLASPLEAEASVAAVDLALLPGIPAAVLFVAAVAWLVTGRALRPVEDIRAQLAGITANDLRRRVPVPAGRDEIQRLAVTTNATLDRLDDAVTSQQRFVADAAHELRSPLTTLRNRLEVALAHPDDARWPAVVAGAVADTGRIQRLANDLLLLAGIERATRERVVDLGAVAEEQVAERAAAVRLTADIGPRCLVRGHEQHLGRLLRNLLDNAARHATGSIEVVAVRRDGEVSLEVRDDGPGVPAADRERIFERFTRLDDARARDAGGTGLGLAIAREIAVHHGGTLRAVDHPMGARFVLTLPAA
jgi:signal transduction histidine kinase